MAEISNIPPTPPPQPNEPPDNLAMRMHNSLESFINQLENNNYKNANSSSYLTAISEEIQKLYAITQEVEKNAR